MSTLHHIDTPAKFKAWCDARKNTTTRDIVYATMSNTSLSYMKEMGAYYEGEFEATIGLGQGTGLRYGWRYTDSLGWRYTDPPSNIDVWVAY